MTQNAYGATNIAASQSYTSSNILGSNAKSSTLATPQKKEQKTVQNVQKQDTFDIFGSFSSVQPKPKPKSTQSEDPFGDFSSVAPQPKQKNLLGDDIFGTTTPSSTAKKVPQDDLFGDFSSVSPAKKPEKPEKKQEENDDDMFGDFTDVKPVQKSLPEKKDIQKDDKQADKPALASPPQSQTQEASKSVGKGSINWSDMTAVNNLISVFKEADVKEAEQQKKVASAQPPVQQAANAYNQPQYQPQGQIHPQVQFQSQVIPQNNVTIQQPQQMMPSYPASNSQVTNAGNINNFGVKPQQTDEWGSFEALAPQKPVEIAKAEPAKIDDAWGDFEDANVQTVQDITPKPKKEHAKVDLTKPLTTDSLFDGVTSISVGITPEPKKEEPVKIDDPWGDFEDAAVPELPPKLPDETPKKEEPAKHTEPAKVDLTKPLTTDSLFDGVTSISVGITPEPKKEEPAKSEEPPKIDDPWGDFEDAAVPELPPKLPDETPKKEEPVKSEEPPKIDDPWGDFEDAAVPELPPKLPDETPKKEEPVKSEEPVKIDDAWGDFEDAAVPELPPKLPDETPKKEEPTKIEETKAESSTEEKSEPKKKDPNSLIDWDMPTAIVPTAAPISNESNSAPNDDIFSLFTGIPSTHEAKSSAEGVSVNLLDFTAPTTTNTATTTAHVDVSDIFGTVSESASKKEGRTIKIDKALLESLIEQERFEEAILCQKDLVIQRKIQLKKKELRAQGKTQPEIAAFMKYSLIRIHKDTH